MEPGASDPITPELQKAEDTLDTALAEACEKQPASKVDTAELIHVDELLDAASDAVKRTISLRRRRRADKAARQAALAALANVESEAGADATHRILRDASGVRWDVFSVHPEVLPELNVRLHGPYAQGWLCFESASEKRRLSPIPHAWQQLTNEQLAQLAGRAEPASRGTPRPASPPEQSPPQPSE